MKKLTTTHVADTRLLRLPGFKDLLNIFSESYDSTLRIESLISLVSRPNLLLGASIVIEHELTTDALKRDVQTRILNTGCLTLLHGEYGSLSVRCVDISSPHAVCSTVLQDTLVYPLKGGPLSGWVLSIDGEHSLEEFRSDATIHRSDETILLDNSEHYLIARSGYDALHLKTEVPTVIAELRLHSQRSYSWIVHETSRRPIRLLVQQADFNHHEMMLLFLAQTPKNAEYTEVVRDYLESACHFVRWAAYSYLLQTEDGYGKLLARMQLDPHPQIQKAAEQMNRCNRRDSPERVEFLR
jgi:hypothetical protein